VNRFLTAAFILFCFEIGLFLIFVPWSVLWEDNFLLAYAPGLRGVVLNNFFRGAVSGLGVIDLLIGISEVALFVKSFKVVNHPTE
jgi:hypothetical protein